MYQKLGTLMYVSMSADALCRGLISQRNRPLMMEMTKGEIPLFAESNLCGVTASLCLHMPYADSVVTSSHKETLSGQVHVEDARNACKSIYRLS